MGKPKGNAQVLLRYSLPNIFSLDMTLYICVLNLLDVHAACKRRGTRWHQRQAGSWGGSCLRHELAEVSRFLICGGSAPQEVALYRLPFPSFQSLMEFKHFLPLIAIFLSDPSLMCRLSFDHTVKGDRAASYSSCRKTSEFYSKHLAYGTTRRSAFEGFSSA